MFYFNGLIELAGNWLGLDSIEWWDYFDGTQPISIKYMIYRKYNLKIYKIVILNYKTVILKIL